MGSNYNDKCLEKRETDRRRSDNRKGESDMMTEAQTGKMSSEEGRRGHKPRNAAATRSCKCKEIKFFPPAS